MALTGAEAFRWGYGTQFSGIWSADIQGACLFYACFCCRELLHTRPCPFQDRSTEDWLFLTWLWTILMSKSHHRASYLVVTGFTLARILCLPILLFPFFSQTSLTHLHHKVFLGSCLEGPLRATASLGVSKWLTVVIGTLWELVAESLAGAMNSELQFLLIMFSLQDAWLPLNRVADFYKDVIWKYALSIKYIVEIFFNLCITYIVPNFYFITFFTICIKQNFYFSVCVCTTPLMKYFLQNTLSFLHTTMKLW